MAEFRSWCSVQEGGRCRVASSTVANRFRKGYRFSWTSRQLSGDDATKEGFHDLVASINEALGDDRRSIDLLDRGFEVCWPALESQLAQVASNYDEEAETTTPAEPVAPRPPEDMLSEILETIRDMNRSDTRLKNAIDGQGITSKAHTHVSSLSPSEKRGTTKTIMQALSRLGYEVLGVKYAADGTAYTFLQGASLTDAEEASLRELLSQEGLGTQKIRFMYSEKRGQPESRQHSGLGD